jgi:hypothetical protein
MGRARNTEMPNLFVIGAAKCGTTSLHYYLDLHPEISMSRIKEPRFFACPEGTREERAITDRDLYLALFEAGKKIRGEASPAYSQHPAVSGVPGRIAMESPDAKFIYLVRDPIERIESQLRMLAALDTYESLRYGRPVDALPVDGLVDASRYMSQIRQYLEVFRAESILVLDSERLARDRRESLAETFRFLGVDTRFEDSEFDHRVNQGDALRALPAPLDRLPGSAPIRKVKSALGARRVRRIRWWISLRFGSPVQPISLSSRLREELKCELRPEIEDLREFTGLKFEGWSI